MKLRDHRAEARNGLIGTFPKALLGEITSRVLVYVHGRARDDSAHATLYNCASDFIRKVIARVDKARRAAFNHFELAQERAQQRLFRAESVLERINTPIEPFLNVTVIGKAARKLLRIVRMRIDKPGKNELPFRMDHPIRLVSGENFVGLSYSHNLIGLDRERAIPENPSLGIDG